MNTDRLALYYDKTYTDESVECIPAIAISNCPTNGLEACCHYIPNLIKGGKILEFGAANGLLMKSLICNGLIYDEYLATDISKPRLSALKCICKLYPNTRSEYLDANDITADSHKDISAVLMLAVIEHLIDPVSSMSRIHDMLSDDGLVYIDTPNIAKYTRRLKLFAGYFPSTASRNEGLTTYQGTMVDLYDEGHLHYFTYRSLSKMLIECCGFSKIEKLGYFFSGSKRRSKLGNLLARKWPSMFSDVAILAYK